MTRRKPSAGMQQTDKIVRSPVRGQVGYKVRKRPYLPKNTEIVMGHERVVIKNHKVTFGDSLLNLAVGRLWLGRYWEELVPKLAECGITFEKFADNCVWELEDDAYVFTFMLMNWWDGEHMDGSVANFVETTSGMMFRQRVIGKIRECRDWKGWYIMMTDGEFRDEMVADLKECSNWPESDKMPFPDLIENKQKGVAGDK